MDMTVSPDISVVTNLSPNHLDIHKSMEEYMDSKKNIFKFQDSRGILVLNLDNEITASMRSEASGRVVHFSRLKEVDEGAFLEGEDLVITDGGRKNVICSMEDVKLPGLHNIENLLAASQRS